MLTKEHLERIEQLKHRYPTTKSLCLPVLWMVQEQEGWISDAAMREVAAVLGLPVHHVYGVVSFYTMFNRKPVGKYHIQICTNVSCQLVGGKKIGAYLCGKLNIRPGETTPDGLFTLTEVECLGSCGTAPMLQVNDQYYENLTTDMIDRLLENWRRRTDG